VAQIEQGLQARLGPTARIETCVVDDIVPETSGKHRYVVSRVNTSAIAALPGIKLTPEPTTSGE